MRSVLVAISPDGPNTHLPRAAWIAQKNGADLTLLCVAIGSADASRNFLGQAREDMLAQDRRITVNTLLRFGRPAPEILTVARETRPDLLMLGISDEWHRRQDWFGEKAFHRYLLRSIAAKLAQEAPCPVWLESPQAGRHDLGEAFCVLDLEKNCEGLVRYAAAFTGVLGAKLTLFHGVASMEVHAPGISRGAIARQRQLARAAEEKIADIQRLCGTAARHTIEVGSGLSTLRKIMRECGSRFLVMDSASNDWGENFRIYAAVRTCGASVLIRRTAKDDVMSPVYAFRRRSALAALIVLLIVALAIALIFLAFYLGPKTDNCRVTPMRCNVPAEFRFQPYDDPP